MSADGLRAQPRRRPGATGIRLALIGLICLAFALFLFRLDGQSLWYDEGVTAWVGGMSPAALVAWTADDIQPPLYYLLAAGWGRVAGWSEWSLRFVSVWFGVLSVALLAAVAGKLTGRRAVAVTAAFLGALHPLWLYYAQEARMYTLLTALGLMAALALLRSVQTGWSGRAPVVYLLVGLAALYTHYFAAFLLLALGILMWLEAGAGNAPTGAPTRTRRTVIWIHALLFLGFLPWLGIMLTRLQVDRSYWQGDFDLIHALQDVAVSFTSGVTVDETRATWLLLGYAAVTLLALARLRQRRAGRVLRWGVLWLVVPVAGVLVLASVAPKFNPRYVMMALPGLLLLWAAGLAPGAPASPPARSGLRPWGAASFLALALLATGFSYAGFNWFTDLSFSKDDWRGVTQFLRPRLREDEAVALVSGHAWPVWDYYAPDIPVVRLPDLDVLDVEAVLDFADTAAPLQAALAPLGDRPGLWWIGWQDEVVDPTGVVPVQMELAGREKGLDTFYWGLELRRYSQLKAHWIPDAPPVEYPMELRLGDDELLLHGVNSVDNGDLLLFWQRLPGAPEDADYHVAGEVYDAAGRPVATIGDQRLAGYDYPSFRWPPERVAMGHLRKSEWLGPDPTGGDYRVVLRLYDATTPGIPPLTTGNGASSVDLGLIPVVID